jgi:hypothetical protein
MRGQTINNEPGNSLKPCPPAGGLVTLTPSSSQKLLWIYNSWLLLCSVLCFKTKKVTVSSAVGRALSNKDVEIKKGTPDSLSPSAFRPQPD